MSLFSKFFDMFRAKTTADIVRPLTNIVDELRAHAEAHHLQADDHLVDAAESKHLSQTARSEANDASSTAAQIATLLPAKSA